jgi:hypothetical protein
MLQAEEYSRIVALFYSPHNSALITLMPARLTDILYSSNQQFIFVVSYY